MGKKIRLAVIGVGMAWERLHYPAIKELKDQYEIVALCNKSIEKAQRFASEIHLPQENVYSDLSELLKREDIDVVDTLVPISENFEVARTVLLAGKNLIAEKPFAATLEGAKELIALKNKMNLNVMVAENFRYDEGNRLMKDILQKKEIGDILYFIFHTAADFEKEMRNDTFAAKEWRQHPNFRGGIFLDGGIHDIALMRYLFGDVKKLSAYGKPQLASYCPYVSIHTMMQFDHGVIGNYSYYANGGELQKPPIGLRIVGTKGDLFLESKDGGAIIVNFADGTSKRVSYTPGRSYYNEFLAYYENQVITTPEKEIEDIELIFNILDKLKEEE